MSVGVRQRLSLPSSVQVFPLLASAVGIVLIVTAAIVRYVDRRWCSTRRSPSQQAGSSRSKRSALRCGRWRASHCCSGVIWRGLRSRRSRPEPRACRRRLRLGGPRPGWWPWGARRRGRGGTHDDAASVEMPVSIYLLVSLPTGRLTTTGVDRVGWVAVAMATAGVCVELVMEPDVADTAFARGPEPVLVGDRLRVHGQRSSSLHRR